MNKFYKELLKHNWLYLTAILILAILLFVLKANMDSADNQIRSQYASLINKSNSLLSLATLRGDFTKANPYFSFLENILPPKDQLLSFENELESIARKNNLEFNFNYGEDKASSNKEPGQISFRAIINGEYDNIAQFLKDAETSRYFIDPSSVDILKKNTGYSATVNGRVFFR